MSRYPKGLQINIQPRTPQDAEALKAKRRALDQIAVDAGVSSLTRLSMLMWDRLIVLTDQGMDQLLAVDAVTREIVAKAHARMQERGRKM